MKRFFIILLVLFCIAIPVSGYRTGGTIGDSIAQGAIGGNISSLLQTDTHFTWYNRGVSGAITEKTLASWYQNTTGLTYIVALTGINDVLHGQYYADYGDTEKNNIYKMAINSSTRNQVVIFVTLLPNDPQGPIKDINSWMKSNLTAIPNIRVYDATPLMDDGTFHIKSVYDSGDKVHPNVVGYIAMGAEIYSQNADIIGYSGHDEFTSDPVITSTITLTPTSTPTPITTPTSLVIPSVTRIATSGANVQRFPDSTVTTSVNQSIVMQESTNPSYPKKEIYYGYIRSMRWNNYCRIEQCDAVICKVIKADYVTRIITVTSIPLSTINDINGIPAYGDLP